MTGVHVELRTVEGHSAQAFGSTDDPYRIRPPASVMPATWLAAKPPVPASWNVRAPTTSLCGVK